MAVEKTVSVKSPFTGKTFQKQTALVAGRSGYVSGAATSDNGSTITVGAFAFLQNGLYVEETGSTVGIAVPTGTEPWFLLASTSDDDPDTAINLSVTRDLGVALVGTVIAYKIGGVWRNPVALSIAAAESEAVADPGKDDGFTVRPVLSGGNVATFDVSLGGLVNPDGTRRQIVGPGSPSDSASITPAAPHETRNRTDYLVLRQREGVTGELVHVVGGAVPDKINDTLADVTETLVASGANERPHYFTKRDAAVNEQWWAWGEGTALRVQGGPAGGAFGPLSVLTGSGTIANTFIVGQRAADSAIIIMYTDGSDLRVVAINSTTGAIIDAAITIDTQGNTITHCRGALDHNEELHVVYQHDENGTGLDEQVYYTRRTTATGGTFANASVTPRIVDGADSNVSDTGPVIVVDRKGIAHVAYITGAAGTSDIFGSLRYSTIDQGGTTTFQKTYSNATATGKQLAGDTPIELYSAGGTTIDNVRFIDLAVTPHDEIYGIVAGKDSGDALPEKTMLFGPGFETRLGFAIVDLLNVGGEIKEAAITSDDQGGLYLVQVYDLGAADTYNVHRIDTVFAPEGIVGDSLLSFGATAPISWTPFVGEILATFGRRGEFVAMFQDAGVSAKTQAHSWNASGSDGLLFSRVPSAHPDDVYLASWYVPLSATAVLPESEVHIFHTRPRKMNFPFLVGDNGDFHGYNALVDALRTANRCGGELVVRNGEYKLNTGLILRGPVRMYGEGMPVLSWEGLQQTRILIADGIASTAVLGISGQVVTVSLNQAQRACPGGLVEMATSGFHRILRVINDKLVLDGVPPVGATLSRRPAGAVFENFTLRAPADDVGFYSVHVSLGNKVRLSNCAFRTDTTVVDAQAVRMENSIDCLIENCDFSEWTAAATGFGVRLTGGKRNRVDGCLFLEAKAKLKITTDEFEPIISNCRTPSGLAGSGLVYEIDQPRTDPVAMINSIGEATASTDLNGIRTHVGETVEGKAQLAFSDDIVRAGTTPDKNIKLSESGSDAFDGASTDVIITAVNQRLLKTGGTMSGDILAAADGQDLGSDGGRWDVFAEKADVGNTTSTDIERLTVTAKTDQKNALGQINGRNGMSPLVLQPTGQWQQRNSYFRDNFFFYNGDLTGSAGMMWDHNSTPTPTIAGPNANNENGLQLVSTAGGPPQDVTVRSAAPAFTNTAILPCFSGKIAVDDLTNTELWFGYGQEGGNPPRGPRFTFISTVSTTNWLVGFDDDLDAFQTIDTGVAVVASTWAYVTLCVLSSTSLLYRIGTTAKWSASDTISHVTSLPGSGTIKQLDYRFVMKILSNNGNQKTGWFGFLEHWELLDA